MALINSNSKINAMNFIYTNKQGFQMQKTEVPT